MRIAVVDGFSMSPVLVQELAQRGAECVHVCTRPNFSEFHTRSFDPTVYAADLGYAGDAPAAAEAVRALGVDAVIPGAESGVILADKIAEALGLVGNGITRSHARRDKVAMAKVVHDTGLAAPSGRLVSSAGEAAEWFAANGSRPVVVKPLASAGTDGVRVCRTAEQARHACENVLGHVDLLGATNHRALVQDYLDGDEYIVNTVTLGGVHKVVEVWRCTKYQDQAGSPIYDHHQAVPRGDAVGEAVVAYTKQAITALGIEHGAGHSEVMMTSTGPVLVETGARLMGTVLPWVHAKYSGSSHVHLYATALTDPDAFLAFDDEAVRWSHVLRQVYLFNNRAGVAEPDDWQESLRSLDTFVALSTNITPGAPVPQTVDLVSIPGHVYLAADSLKDIERDHAEIRAMESAGIYVG
ncbi:biotin carboxylase [Saccharopolyspora lacisalsi]|uniref:Biotin carboxylase n=1 Tax=Halosaccharopolyspora lacisalsi TaxID=1000566 RepID=A0A839E578_9PSEU|nr:ATP-grasp domain-containing protein [Halosaccharopolyspora lacisalsi]MBA8827776.1 biotin carboxylase [Halosaccharopolyspora lacisalsi]